VTEIYALSTSDAFFVIDFGAPRYLISGNALVSFFRHNYGFFSNLRRAGAGI
jgi:hypothetical protein